MKKIAAVLIALTMIVTPFCASITASAETERLIRPVITFEGVANGTELAVGGDLNADNDYSVGAGTDYHFYVKDDLGYNGTKGGQVIGANKDTNNSIIFNTYTPASTYQSDWTGADSVWIYVDFSHTGMGYSFSSLSFSDADYVGNTPTGKYKTWILEDDEPYQYEDGTGGYETGVVEYGGFSVPVKNYKGWVVFPLTSFSKASWSGAGTNNVMDLKGVYSVTYSFSLYNEDIESGKYIVIDEISIAGQFNSGNSLPDPSGYDPNESLTADVISAIEQLPDTVTIDDELTVKEARAAYDSLPAISQPFVTNYDKLLELESDLDTIKVGLKFNMVFDFEPIPEDTVLSVDDGSGTGTLDAYTSTYGAGGGVYYDLEVKEDIGKDGSKGGKFTALQNSANLQKITYNTYSMMPYKVDWTGAYALYYWIDFREYSGSWLYQQISFTEEDFDSGTATGNYEEWVPKDGMKYYYGDGQGQWIEGTIAYNGFGIPVDNYMGWVMIPLSSMEPSSYNSPSCNGILDKKNVSNVSVTMDIHDAKDTYAVIDNIGLSGLFGSGTALPVPGPELSNGEIAQNVIDMIGAIPTPVSLSSIDAVISARETYNALTATQKLMVTNVSLLIAAEQDISDMNSIDVSSEDYRLGTNVIDGFTLGETIGTITAKITLTAGVLTAYNADGTTASSADTIKTGMEMRVTYKGGFVKKYTAIVYGDVDGSGTVSISSLVIIKKHIVKSAELQGVYLLASDTNADNIVNSYDISALKKELLTVSGGIEKQNDDILSLDGQALTMIYVSALTGNDSNNGSEENPVKTLQKAVAMSSPGTTVIVDDGIYRETLTPKSGTSEQPIVFKAKEGASPKITGADTVTSAWSNYSGNIWKTNLSGMNITDIDHQQIFVNEKMMTEARWPKLMGGMDNIADYKRAVCENGTDKDGISYTGLPDVDLTGAIVAVWPGELYVSGWVGMTRTIVANTTSRIAFDREMCDPDPLMNLDSYTPYPGNPFYIYGALGLLTSPGEYFYDDVTKDFYIWMPDSSEPEGNLIEFKSSRRLAVNLNNARNVSVEGFNVYGATFSMDNAVNCAITNLSVKYADHFREADGYNATAPNRICVVTGKWNTVSGTSIDVACGSGIFLGGNNNKIYNNTISNTNYSGALFGAVYLEDGLTSAVIRQNSFINSGKAHIQVQPGSNLYGNTIEYNYMREIGCMASDQGAFYAWHSNGHGTIIRHNYIVSGDKGDNGTFESFKVGIYLDTYCENYEIYRNVIQSVGAEGTLTAGIQLNLYARNIICYHNTIIGAQDGFAFFGYPGDSVNNADLTGTKIFNNYINCTRRQYYIQSKDYTYFNRTLVGSGGKIDIIDNPLHASYAPDSGNNYFGGVDADGCPTNTSAIDGGISLPGYNDSYTGTAPDAGYRETGSSAIVYGSWNSSYTFN